MQLSVNTSLAVLCCTQNWRIPLIKIHQWMFTCKRVRRFPKNPMHLLINLIGWMAFAVFNSKKLSHFSLLLFFLNVDVSVSVCVWYLKRFHSYRMYLTKYERITSYSGYNSMCVIATNVEIHLCIHETHPCIPFDVIEMVWCFFILKKNMIIPVVNYSPAYLHELR